MQKSARLIKLVEHIDMKCVRDDGRILSSSRWLFLSSVMLHSIHHAGDEDIFRS